MSAGRWDQAGGGCPGTGEKRGSRPKVGQSWKVKGGEEQAGVGSWGDCEKSGVPLASEELWAVTTGGPQQW